MFPALRDNRIELVRATSSELTISISDVTLSDEGMYTCSLFTMPVRTAKAYLTVLGEYKIQSKSKNSTSKENFIDGRYSSYNVCKICSDLSTCFSSLSFAMAKNNIYTFFLNLNGVLKNEKISFQMQHIPFRFPFTSSINCAVLLEPCFSFLRLSAYWFAVMLCC